MKSYLDIIARWFSENKVQVILGILGAFVLIFVSLIIFSNC